MNSTKVSLLKPKMTLQERVAYCAAEGPDAINTRLEELNGEWSAGRMVKATLGIVITVGFVLATLVSPYWLILPAIAGGFLMQYVFWRGGLLTELFGSLGYRGNMDIDEERYALRTLRGDFRNLPTVYEVVDKDSVCRLEDEGGPALDSSEHRYDHREAAEIIISAGK